MAFSRELCSKLLRFEFHKWCPVRSSGVVSSNCLTDLSQQICFLPWTTGRRPSSNMVRKCLVYLCVYGNDLFKIRSSYLITIVFMLITAAVLAEICSALPLSGSIYIWAAESAGPKYARFFGFVVAWWACTAWMTFAAGNCQVRLQMTIVFASCLMLLLFVNLDDHKLYSITSKRLRS